LELAEGRAAARVGAVDHVVVDQRGAVQKFDDGGEANGAAILAARVACGEKQESGAQALPSPAEQVRGDFRDSGKAVSLCRASSSSTKGGRRGRDQKSL